MDQVVATQGSAQAAYDHAVADLGLAKLNLERSEVRASVNGVVTNMELRPGTYLTPGKGVMALLDTDTLHVQGYFEETKLPRIHVGDPVKVRLMGSDQMLRGRVESVAAGIEDRDPAPARPCLPTSIRRSTGCGWLNACRSGLPSTTTSATNSSQEPLRLSRCSDRLCGATQQGSYREAAHGTLATVRGRILAFDG
jgi:hypothetical protein